MKFRALALAALATTLSLAAAVAPAYADAVVKTQRVSLAEFDFSAAQDVERLYRRLRSAARDVCALQSVPGAYSQPCAEQALETAVEQVGQPALEAVHRAKRS